VPTDFEGAPTITAGRVITTPLPTTAPGRTEVGPDGEIRAGVGARATAGAGSAAAALGGAGSRGIGVGEAPDEESGVLGLDPLGGVPTRMGRPSPAGIGTGPERSVFGCSLGTRVAPFLCCAYWPKRSPGGRSGTGVVDAYTSAASDSRRVRSSAVAGRDTTGGSVSAGRDGGRAIGRAGGSVAALIAWGRSPSRRESADGSGGIAGLDGRTGPGIPSLPGIARRTSSPSPETVGRVWSFIETVGRV